MPRRTDIDSIMIIGSGPIVIGQACEFDYSGTQALRVLRDEGYRVVLLNSNPATIMTDPDFAEATYLEPITPDIVTAIEENPALCNHVHLPVQSGSSRVLARMERLYSREEYLARIDNLKQARREVALSTDIIVGFPGETEEDFAQTLSLLDEVEYDSVFSFKYSPRANTSAAAYDDPVPEQEKSRRLTTLQEKQRRIQIRKNATLIGREEEVLVEGWREKFKQWIGRTTQNRVLNFSTPAAEPVGNDLRGSYCRVRVTASGPNSLVGEFVSQVARPRLHGFRILQ